MNVGWRKVTRHRGLTILTGVALLVCLPGAVRAQKNAVNLWLTTPDRASLLAEQPAGLALTKLNGETPTIVVDDTVHFQHMAGFGFALSGGSAELLMRMTPDARTKLLRELFAPNAEKSIGVSYLRVSIGSSDMNERVFAYDDMPDGELDPQLAHFGLGSDKADVVPVLKEILTINPQVKILGSPWSPPSWMKTNDAPKAGSLKPEYYQVYAQYFVKYLQAMAAEGIHLDAITVQNEPLNKNNTPSLYMPANEEDAFIKGALGPALQAAGLRTQIILTITIAIGRTTLCRFWRIRRRTSMWKDRAFIFTAVTCRR